MAPFLKIFACGAGLIFPLAFNHVKDQSQSVNMNFDQNVGGISTEKWGIRAVLSYADLLLQTTSGNCSSILYKAK